jgi:FtsP/CotA-like multicopper oxidase with cupredoxin domain
MSRIRLSGIVTLALTAVLLAGAPVGAQVLVQCPCDQNNDGDCEDIKNGAKGYDEPALADSLGVQCMHLSGGDGFSTMADGRTQYIFSYADLTGIGDVDKDGDISDDIMEAGALAAAWPAPPIVLDEGKKFYLTLSNVGMLIRPDLFDPHTIHFHGFPESSNVFDGLPESGISINMGASLTYFYQLNDPGTYMYHCHVEATEHMQMGMLGNLYVRPLQNTDGYGGDPATVSRLGGNPDSVVEGYVYNDGDGSTAYDVEKALQLGSFDPEFHDASWFTQPLPFAYMFDTYPMINGRGYPDTVNMNSVCTVNGNSCTTDDDCDLNDEADVCGLPAPAEVPDGVYPQVEDSLVIANAGDRILLRLSNLNITKVHTFSSPSIPMKVVGIDAKQLLAEDGSHLYYETNSVTMGGGMSYDVILDTATVPAGEYWLYASNLQYLANNEAPGLGGMITKIVLN